MATNHYGHFLMTNMLLPLLKKSQPSRIINLTSMGHQFAKWNFDDLEYTKSYSPWGAYGNSKLANIYFTTELQRRLKGDKIKVFAVHPGGVRTELGNTFINSSFIIRLFFKLLSPIWWYFSKSVPQGAQTSLYCALADFDKIEGGKYYADCRVGKPTALSQSEENAKKFWDISVAKVGFKEGQK
jgi:retinol dehydrogenase-12